MEEVALHADDTVTTAPATDEQAPQDARAPSQNAPASSLVDLPFEPRVDMP
jgi:hypothetical protein